MDEIDQIAQKKAAKPAGDGARGELLRGLVPIAVNAANAQLEAFSLRLVSALMQFSDDSGDAKQASLSFNASNLLKKNTYVFQFLATDRLQKTLQREMDMAIAPFSSAHAAADDVLALVPYADMEKKVSLGNVARTLETSHADQFTALRMRLAHLLGREDLSGNKNPFRPEVLLSAINDSWCEFNPDPETHSLVLPLLRPEVFLDLAPILSALNNEMIASGVMPQLAAFYNIKKTSDHQEAKSKERRLNPEAMQQLRRIFSPQDASATAPMHFGNDPTPMIPGAPLIPGLGGMPGYDGPAAFNNSPMQASVASNQLLGFLVGLQKTQADLKSLSGPAGASMLASIKAKAPPGALTRVDESTIDLLGKIFDVVFRDQNIPPEIKDLMGFLQVPVLQAALVDKEFFFEEEHPARRLIELLTRTSVGWDQSKGEDDPLYQTIKRNIHRVQQQFEHQATVFSEVVSDLESFIQQEENTSVEALSEPIARALKQERWGQATIAAKSDVALRIGTGEVVAFVETFLENKWTSVLTIAYSVKDEKPQVVESALKTMDDLVWSVKPKITQEERKELIAKLPSLISMLNKWLNLVKLDDAERLQFFAELAECHASIVRAPLEMSPQRRLEIAVQVAKDAAERRLQKLAAKEPEPERVADDFVNHVETLERGRWLEFTQKDATIKKMKLSWVSPLRSLFIFSSTDKTESFSLSADDLAQSLREGHAHVLVLGGLVDRAISEALETIGANDEHMHEQSAA